MERYIAKLNDILTKLFISYEKNMKDPGVLLSGGIDSSLVTYFVSRHFSDFHIISVGTKDSKDKKYIDILCRMMHKKPEWVPVGIEEIKEHFQVVRSLLIKGDIEPSLMQLSLAIGVFFCLKKAKDLGIKNVFSGQGPDVLFAGYHKYKGVKNVNEQIKKDLSLLHIDKKRENAIAQYFQINIIYPYLEQEIIDLSLRIPSQYKIKDGIEKYVLRQYAKHRGIPEEIIKRPKKAFQYSTGIQKMFERNILNKM